MRELIDKAVVGGVLVSVLGLAVGCGGAGDQKTASESGESRGVSSGSSPQKGGAPPVLSLGERRASQSEKLRQATMEPVHNALKPLQKLVGQWRGVTQKTIGGAASLEEPVWSWDFLTSPQQPALVMTADSSPYLKSARLTWLSDEREFELTARDGQGSRRVYRGTFAHPADEPPGRDGRPQRSFRLVLDQVSPPDVPRFSRLVLVQQENDRYLMEVYDHQSGQFTRYDTVVNQRQGSSRSQGLLRNGEEKIEDHPCIMRHGPGTIPVEHGGETYWVCCPGCRAAFQDDPEHWISRFRREQL